MPLEKVNQHTQVEVGKYYLVLCILKENTWIPVIGKAHRDPQLGFKVKHFHIDNRFNSIMIYKRYVDGKLTTKTNAVITIEGIEVQLKWMRKKCIFPFAGIIGVNRRGAYDSSIASKFMKTYIGKSCKGRKCPHYGHHMHAEDGKLVCPLHGLKGDIEKEVIIDGPFYNEL